MGKNYDYDYIIIGSGPAGRTVASKLAEAKKHVAIVESEEFGGAEINTRDLPYHLSLDFAHHYHYLSTHPALTSVPHFNLPTLISYRQQIIAEKRSALIQDLSSKGVDIVTGFAHFLDNHTIAVDDGQLTAHFFILATGSDLKASEISGLDSVGILTPDTALNVRRLPRFVFVVGGGPTGVQIAEYFASLGTGVIIMERGTHLLPREDDDVADLVTDYFTNRLGITVVPNSKVITITEDFTSKIVVFTAGNGEKMVRVDCVVLATGSEPFLDYGLENAGIDYKRTGILVDKYFTTTAKNIFAIGDCVDDSDSSTDRAILQANVLAENLLHRQKSTAKYSSLVRAIDLNTSIAVTGLNERDALSRDLRYQKSIKPLDGGFIKTLSDHSGRHLGTTIVAPHAAEALKMKKLLTK